MDKVPKEECVS